MGGARHTAEEVKWAEEKMAQLQDNPKPDAIQQLNLLEEYHNKFGKKLSIPGFVTWLKAVKWPEKFGYPAIKRKEEAKKAKAGAGEAPTPRKKKQKADLTNPDVNFIVFVGNSAVGAFRTAREVKNFFATSQLINGMQVFKKIPYKMKYSIEI